MAVKVENIDPLEKDKITQEEAINNILENEDNKEEKRKERKRTLFQTSLWIGLFAIFTIFSFYLFRSIDEYKIVNGFFVLYFLVGSTLVFLLAYNFFYSLKFFYKLIIKNEDLDKFFTRKYVFLNLKGCLLITIFLSSFFIGVSYNISKISDDEMYRIDYRMNNEFDKILIELNLRERIMKLDESQMLILEENSLIEKKDNNKTAVETTEKIDDEN